MPSCAFTRCNNHSKSKNKSHGITFHSFPEKELLRRKWLLVVRRQRQEPDWTPNKNTRVCSVHFKAEDIYTTNKGYKKLSNTAVPFFLQPDNFKIKVEPEEEITEEYVASDSENELEEKPDVSSIRPDDSCDNRTENSELARLASAVERLENAVATKMNTENDPRDEFELFGQNVAAQLRNMPVKDALELEMEIQDLISQKRLNILQNSQHKVNNYNINN